MSRPDHASTFPISDLDLSRDVNCKFRLAGLVTSVSPFDYSLITLTDPYPAPGYAPVSLLVDLSLCSEQNGWKRGAQNVPPVLKSKVMVIGHLFKHDTPVDVSFVTEHKRVMDLGMPQVRDAVRTFQDDEELVPNRYFVLEAILVKQLDHTFDLRLWNTAARLRSQHEWNIHAQSVSNKKGKLKAID